MIPEHINIEELAQDLEDDFVAMGSVTGEQYPTMEPDLIRIAEGAGHGEFGSLGVVVLDSAPPVTADLRDVAQELLQSTAVDTVVVRAPGSGAVVSDVHSRATLESAQHGMLGTHDYITGTELLIRDVTESGLGNIDWVPVTIFGVIALLAALLVAAVFVRKRPFRSPRA